MVERLWPEVNRLVNYPIKKVLNNMANRDEIDTGNRFDKYVISKVALQLVEIGRQRFVRAWNHKNIPRKLFNADVRHQYF